MVKSIVKLNQRHIKKLISVHRNDITFASIMHKTLSLKISLVSAGWSSTTNELRVTGMISGIASNLTKLTAYFNFKFTLTFSQCCFVAANFYSNIQS